MANGCVRCAVLLLLAATSATTAAASPNLTLDHPAYEVLDRRRAMGDLGPVLGGFRPLSIARVRALLRSVGESDATLPDEHHGLWVSPLHAARATLLAIREDQRPYSTSVRPRTVAGHIAISCERNEGRPCGEGLGVYSELEGAAGYEEWIAIVGRAQIGSGTADQGTTLNIARLYASGALGPFAYEIGRDALLIGAQARTNLVWSRHAAPLDHVRLSTGYPWHVLASTHISGHYVVGRPAKPQDKAGNLVTLARGQIDVGRSLEIGLNHMLQLGGEGAPALGFVDFVLEHVRRADRSAREADTSNRRFGLDIAGYIPELGGLRVYYATVFEDIRKKRFIDALRYDADHLVGIDVAALGPQRQHGLVVEWHTTGYRSHEHTARLTGFTHGGRVVGSPLGPDASSFYLEARLPIGITSFRPWLEIAQLSSDAYTSFEFGPIVRVPSGIDEDRWRAGALARTTLPGRLQLDIEAWIERVDDFAFVDGSSRTNAGISSTITWYPGGKLGTLIMD